MGDGARGWRRGGGSVWWLGLLVLTEVLLLLLLALALANTAGRVCV